jgi:hypothetical protein
MENLTIEQRLQRIESLLKPQKNAFTLDKKRRRKAKKYNKILIILIEKMIEQLLPYAIPFIIHFWDNICNLL